MIKDTITVDASIDNINIVTVAINDILSTVGCSLKVMTAIDVAIDELLSNIVFYAYPDGHGVVTVSISVEDDPRAVAITFTDDGVPYNPLLAEDPDITLSAENRKIGGLGIFIVKNTMDDVLYHYTDNKNVLTIVKNIG